MFLCVVAVAHAAGVEAKVPSSKTSQPNGEIAVDVTVRRHPNLSAAGLTDLVAGTPVHSARARVRGWTRITIPIRGWIPAEAFGPPAQESAPLAEGETQLQPVDPAGHAGTAGASSSRRRRRGAGHGAAPEGGGVTEASSSSEERGAQAEPQEAAPRSDSDLMLEALKATRGESPNAARIARVVAETTIEAKRKRIATPVLTFWKDPFVADSDPPAVVRLRRSRRAGAAAVSDPADPHAELLAARQETARARAEAAAARAEAAAVRADAARVKAELARREASAAHADAMAAKHDAEAARAGCSIGPAPVRALLGRGSGWRSAALRAGSRSDRSHKAARAAQALNAPVLARGATRRAVDPGVDDAPAEASPPPSLDPPPAPAPAMASHSTTAGNRGILVVPINPPVSAR